MTKCQKNTIFDSFPNICQNVIFHRSPIFPKNTKTPFFTFSPMVKTPFFTFSPAEAKIRKYPILPILGISWKTPFLSILEDLPKYPIFGHFLENPKNALFTPTPRNPNFCGGGVRLPPHALLKREYLTNPMGVCLYFLIYYIWVILCWSFCKSLNFSQFHIVPDSKKWYKVE